MRALGSPWELRRDSARGKELPACPLNVKRAAKTSSRANCSLAFLAQCVTSRRALSSLRTLFHLFPRDSRAKLLFSDVFLYFCSAYIFFSFLLSSLFRSNAAKDLEEIESRKATIRRFAIILMIHTLSFSHSCCGAKV